MNKLHLTLVALAAGTLGGCGSGPAESAAEVEEAQFEGAQVEAGAVPGVQLARARETADDLTRDLAGLVMTTMQEQGPVAAIEVCSGVAQERTAAHAREGVQVRRVSSRVRNPLNAPDPSEVRELELLESLSREGRMPTEIIRLVRSGDGRALHYVRPIVIGAPCMTCHGPATEIPAEVRSILQERFPDDAATGYQVGDLRGGRQIEDRGSGRPADECLSRPGRPG